MIRKDAIIIPDWFKNVKSGDFFLYNLLAGKGTFYFSNETMGVYRNHSNGVSKIHNRREWIISNLENMKNFQGNKVYKPACRNFSFNAYIELYNLCILENSKFRGLYYILKALFIFPNGILNFNHLLKMIKDTFFHTKNLQN